MDEPTKSNIQTGHPIKPCHNTTLQASEDQKIENEKSENNSTTEAKGMPELMKYNVEKNYKTTPNHFLKKLQKLENLEFKLQELKKKDAECDSQIEQLK